MWIRWFPGRPIRAEPYRCMLDSVWIGRMCRWLIVLDTIRRSHRCTIDVPACWSPHSPLADVMNLDVSKQKRQVSEHVIQNKNFDIFFRLTFCVGSRFASHISSTPNSRVTSLAMPRSIKWISRMRSICNSMNTWSVLFADNEYILSRKLTCDLKCFSPYPKSFRANRNSYGCCEYSAWNRQNLRRC